ncbi:MAG: Methylase involved in ubiquinone/menaquinone biosynthesis [Bacteroidetes bacterium]|nr:Methylase involved in ubiquinone/menaquinone biosynthesis [Bacteroidota bacterium]
MVEATIPAVLAGIAFTTWRGAGAVELATLERWYTGNGIVGSNPTLSARHSDSLELRCAHNENALLVIIRVQRIVPTASRRVLKSAFYRLQHAFFPSKKWPVKPGETSKAKGRRLREGFFERFCSGKGIDIGYGGDPLKDDCDVWEAEHGDAQFLPGVEDNSYDFVYSSHTLEHMRDAAVALQNWWRVVRPGGFLILYVPDRDLYEKKTTLPSKWNPDHKTFFLLDRDEKPDTVGLLPMIERTLLGFEVVQAKRCSDGHTIDDPARHSDGEYSIEIVIRKLT